MRSFQLRLLEAAFDTHSGIIAIGCGVWRAVVSELLLRSSLTRLGGGLLVLVDISAAGVPLFMLDPPRGGFMPVNVLGVPARLPMDVEEDRYHYTCRTHVMPRLPNPDRYVAV